MAKRAKITPLYSTTLHDPGDVNRHAGSQLDDIFAPPVVPHTSKEMKAKLKELRKIRRHES
jgi:hypothetical protein